MTIQTLSRCGIAIFLAALASGCSWTGSKTSDHGDTHGNQCKANPSSCMYEGHYEPGERGYAEQEAKQLNQAESEKMRGW